MNHKGTEVTEKGGKRCLGKVYLVGAGPGDPGLMTLKGKGLLECADVVVYDALVSPQILAMINPQAEKIDAGKRMGRHSRLQEETTQVLIEKAQTQAVVVRLKGGDPFVFGRGGEEMQDLVEAGVPVEVVPGVTSGIAAPAYAGIPLTHRSYSSSVTFVTGSRVGRKISTKRELGQCSPRFRNHCDLHGCSQFALHRCRTLRGWVD
jgi:uroporphyrin-III C-methyltransferase